LKPALYGYPPDDVIQFFKMLGVEPNIEKDGCVFTKNNKASDILNVLINELNSKKISIKKNSKVLSIHLESNVFKINLYGDLIKSKKIIIATGGLSYPKTGSTGDGYLFAKSFGHEIIQPRASLVPLLVNDKLLNTLAGLTVKNIKIKTKIRGKALKVEGDLLFTHDGLSGPAIFDLSSEIDSFPENEEVELNIDFLPQIDEKEIITKIIYFAQRHPHKYFKSLFEQFLPKSLLDLIFEQCKVEHNIPFKRLDKNSKTKILKTLKEFKITINSTAPIEVATITRGGVNTIEIDKNSMESKITKGLYFAGEVIDVDGKCGGYNLQMCWATGRLAGISASKSIGN
jgi:predicted Rossmann fold flavoprotein